MILQSFMFEVGPFEANLHLLANERTRAGILSDAGAFDPSVIEFAAGLGLTMEAILITHLHHDHIAGVAEYASKWKCKVFSPAPIPDVSSAEIVKPGEFVRVAGFEFKVIKTSGHTPESVSYYCASESVCLVGDAIFAGAVGGTSNDELHEEEIGWLRKGILTLPPETLLLSGHGPATTVAIETAANPFLQPGFTRLPV